MAVKRDVQNIIKGYDLKTKSKMQSHTSAPYVSVYDLKLQYHSNETTALSPHFNVQTLPSSSAVMLNSTHIVLVAMPFLQSPVFGSVNDTKQNKKKPIHSTVQVYKYV